MINGGRFGHGFISSFVTAGALGSINLEAGPLRFATAVVMQGTLTEAFGSKFINGAMNAAFTEASNNLPEDQRERMGRKLQKEIEDIRDVVKYWLKYNSLDHPNYVNVRAINQSLNKLATDAAILITSELADDYKDVSLQLKGKKFAKKFISNLVTPRAKIPDLSLTASASCSLSSAACTSIIRNGEGNIIYSKTFKP